MGSRFYLCDDLERICLCRFCNWRFCPDDCGMAGDSNDERLSARWMPWSSRCGPAKFLAASFIIVTAAASTWPSDSLKRLSAVGRRGLRFTRIGYIISDNADFFYGKNYSVCGSASSSFWRKEWNTDLWLCRCKLRVNYLNVQKTPGCLQENAVWNNSQSGIENQ